MSKITEKVVRAEMSAANAASRHMPIGLRGAKTGKGYSVAIVYRQGGSIAATLEGLTASEASTAVNLFNAVALATQPEGAQI